VQHRFINLTFHGIGAPGRSLEPGERKVWVSLERFTTVLDAVMGRDDVHITFDDGNRSDLELALPALRDRRLTATFFVIADRLSTPRFLDVADVKTLAAEGMTIGSHGMRHLRWRDLGDAELREELLDSRRLLEDVVGGPVVTAACPFGSYGARSLRALRHAGYARVFTSDRGPTDPHAWLQPRTTITEDDPLAPILSSEMSPYAALRRRAKLTVKRWR
jgi:peptidoglycan/xylan/chitin deacetylase (PgdA/CDA1 family)